MTQRALPFLILTSWALGACASAPDDAPPTQHDVEMSEVALADASASRPRTQHETRVGDWRIALWNEPAFQRRLAESYVAETETEPTLSGDEIETMQAVSERLTADDLDGAATLLEGVRSDTSSAALDFTLGNVRYEQERFDDARAMFQSAVEKHPRFRRAWSALAEIAFRQEAFGDARDAFTKLISLGGGDAITYGLLGFCHVTAEDFVAAESAFRMATMLDPGADDWKFGLAESFRRQSRFADAVALFGGLIAAHPERAQLWLSQAEAYDLMGEPEKAAAALEVVDQLGAATAATTDRLADIYASRELFDLAVDSYLRALDLDPDAGVERALRGAKVMSANGAFDETKRLVAGIEAARADRLTDDDEKDLLRIRARIAAATGATTEQVAALEEIVALDPLDGDALIALAQNAALQDDNAQAVLFFERAARIDGFEAKAKRGHAELLVRQGEYDAALPLLKRVLTLDPRDSVARFVEQVERAAQGR